MKKTDLVEIIRTVVREEINNSLPQFLMEVLAEKISNGQESLIENSAAQPSRAQSTPRSPVQAPVVRKKPLVTLEEGFKRPTAPVPKIITNNPALTAVLAETAGGIPTQEEVDEITPTDAFVNSLPPELLQESAVQAAVSAQTRDYSKLLKAMDAKARR